MNASYNDFLVRLKNERIRYKMTQKEMSGKLKVVQNHYSKIECGKKRMSYYEINHLCETELDIYYIFTGKSCEKKSYEKVERRHAMYCLRIINLLAYNRSIHADPKQEQWRSIYQQTKYLNYIDDSYGSKTNIFYAVRKHLGCTQMEMSQNLGVDVKKLRDLESGRVLPDSELMFNLYQHYGVSPSAFLENSHCAQSEIEYLVENADHEVGETLNECVTFVMEHW